MSNATPKSHSLVARLTSAALLGGRAVRNKAPIASTLAVLLLAPGLSGCILGTERPELNLEIPAAYREAQKRAPDAAVPALDWWRGFRSAELTSLMDAKAYPAREIVQQYEERWRIETSPLPSVTAPTAPAKVNGLAAEPEAVRTSPNGR